MTVLLVILAQEAMKKSR